MLDELLKQNKSHPEALKLKGHSHFLEGNIFDSDEAYIAFLQGAPTKETDYKVLQRLGLVQSERKAWGDAKAVFMKCVSEQDKAFMNSWLQLSRACMRNEDMLESEDSVMHASIMDQ